MHLITRIFFSFTIALLCINAKAQLTITDQKPTATDEDTPIELTIDQLIITDQNNTDPNNYILTVYNGLNYSYSENTITPATNFNGTLSVPVTVNNGIEESNTYNFILTVSGVNDTPEITSLPTTTNNEDEAYSYYITATDVDNDPLHFTLTEAPSWLSLSDNGNGTASLTGTPTNSDVGNHTVTITVSDNTLTSQQTFIVEVVNVNDAPVITGISTALNTNEDSPITLQLTDFTVTDVDNSYPADFSLIVTDGDNYSILGNTITPDLNFNGTLTVPVKVNDGIDDSNIYSLSLTVNDINDAPKIDGTTDAISTNEDTPTSLSLSNFNVTDVDNSYPTGFSLNVIDGDNYSVSGNTITPDADFNGILNVPIIISDGTDDSSPYSLSVTVNAVNDAPVITGTTNPISTSEDTPITLSLNNFNITDTDNSYPTGFSLIVNTGTNYTVSGNTVTPNTNFNGTLTVPIQVNDNQSVNNLSNIYNLTITVTAVNDAPVITGTTNPISTSEDTPITLSLNNFNITDADNSYPTGFSLIVNTGTNYTVSGNTVTPNTNFNGTLTVPIQVNDNQSVNNLSNIYNLSITVMAVNDAPVISGTTNPISTNEDTPITLSLNNFNTTDADNTYPTGFSLIVNTGTNYTVSGNTVTPNTNFNGTLTVTIQVNDNQSVNNLSNTYNLSITVTAVNDAPVISGTTNPISTSEDTPITLSLNNFNVTDTDNSYPTGFSLIVNTGTNYTVSGNTVTPNTNFNGTLTVTIQVNDNQSVNNLSNIYNLSLAVNAVNDNPIAQNINTTTKENSAANISILSSISDVDNNISLNSLSVSQLPAHGTTSIDKVNGVITYTPTTGFTGNDTFKYTICDTQNACATATVSITVSNEAPTAVNDVVNLNEDGIININVLSNDNDPQNNISPASLTIINQPAHGTAVINSNHTITYTPTINYNGSDNFSYQICDATSYCATANVSITINAVNDAPVLTDDSATTPEDTPILVNVLSNDYDAKDAGSSINTSSLSITIQPAHGTAIVQNGQIYYTPAANYFGTDVLTYSVSDNGLPLPALTVSAKLNITITSVNDKPQITGQQSISTNEDTPLTLNITQLSITDVDNSQTNLSIIVSAGTNYTTNNTTITPSSNYNGNLTIPIQVSDGQLLSDIFNLTVTVNAVNDKPMAMDETFYTAESTPINLNVLVNDTDASDPSGGINTSTLTILRQPAHGSAIILPNYTINYSPNSAYWGNDTIVYRIQDKGYPMPALADTATVVIKISRLTPEAIDDNVSTTEDKSISINLLENDTDTGNNIDPSTVQIMAQPSHGTLNGLQGGIVTYSPSINYNGSDYFTYQVKDITNLTSNIAMVNISILPVNDAPVAQNDTYNVYTSQPTVIEVLSNDTDVDNNLDASLTQVTTLPTYGNAIVNTNGTITYTSDNGFTGSDSFTYSITDSDGLTASATVFLTIQTGNIAPTAVNDYTQTNEDQLVDINPLANDSDPNNNLNNESLAITTLPKHGTASIGAQQHVTYTPEANYNGNDTIMYQICDTGLPSSLCATAQIIITVAAINDAPVAQNDEIETVDGANMVADILNNDSDADNDALTPTLINDVPDARYQLSINSNGKLEITTATGSYCYDATINYTISDGNGATSTAAINISVLPGDNDQDGIPNAVEGLEIDSDNDLTPNYLDTDSDNDNIPDITESQMSDACTDEPVDTDNDGTPNYLDSDCDNDGVADIAEGIDDCDNDGTVNYIDAIDDCPDRVLVAETFSPNGDGINDYFVIPIISEYPQNELSVFNRWGAQVYTKVNYDNSWDGRSSSSTLNSDILPEGTYFYVLKLGNDSRVLKGFIYIKR